MCLVVQQHWWLASFIREAHCTGSCGEGDTDEGLIGRDKERGAATDCEVRDVEFAADDCDGAEDRVVEVGQDERIGDGTVVVS